MQLRPFDPGLAPQVSSWARTESEVVAWCSRTEVPVPSEVIAGWGAEPDVVALGLFEGDDLVAYGELWVDGEEAEVELARLIVAPPRRGVGVGRELARLLAERARLMYPTVFLRVRRNNNAALRSYVAAGFTRIAADEEKTWNEGQPVEYAWMKYEG
jgi:ribosomal protein S18 acetylase RimI-like enzyme